MIFGSTNESAFGSCVKDQSPRHDRAAAAAAAVVIQK